MPNLQQLIALRERYKSKNDVSAVQIRALNENFRLSASQIKSSFQTRGLNGRILRYFEDQESTTVVLLFIDITGFSRKCKSFTNSLLSSYLDQYYDRIIPLIYKHGGEIEKIIGDGIIAVFGQPFLEDSESGLLEKADSCAKDIIIISKDTYQEVKIALHEGEIMYYKNKSLSIPEYTVIGRPVTELFRLESVALNNSISFYSVSKYDLQKYSMSGAYCKNDDDGISCKYFNKSIDKLVTLEGVDHQFIKHLSCTT